MLRRQIVCGLLLSLTATLDLGLPTWINTPVVPSCLLLLFVSLCQTLRGGELVFWSGMIGLVQDFVLGEAPGVGIMTLSTLALIVACRQRAHSADTSLVDRLLSGLGLLIALALVRGIRVGLAHPGQPFNVIASALVIRAAATYLLFVAITLLVTGVRCLGRRSYRLESSCV
ncbi:rod shape-determining protein MreD [Planctomicrobium sp. SH661]|uniref:rod shape-determining protein MreD n=1 Tax=Planctomicrobium sp. SH661 TaxID=3448124 RepID=UPI003F5C157A